MLLAAATCTLLVLSFHLLSRPSISLRERGREMKGCELCDRAARMYCESDRANLCWDCDGKVHGANFLVARHPRVLLCRTCQAPTPWRASGSRLTPTFSACDSCSSTLLKSEDEDWVGDPQGGEELMDEDDYEDANDSEGDGDEDEDEEEDEEEGENQVVPLSETLPPPPASSSSGEESSWNGRESADLASQSSLSCSPSHLNGISPLPARSMDRDRCKSLPFFVAARTGSHSSARADVSTIDLASSASRRTPM